MALTLDKFLDGCRQVADSHTERAAAITEAISSTFAHAERRARARLDAIIPEPDPSDALTAALTPDQRKRKIPAVTPADLGMDDFDEEVKAAGKPVIVAGAMAILGYFGQELVLKGLGKTKVDEQIDNLGQVGKGTQIMFEDALNRARDKGLTVGEAEDLVDRLGRMADYAAEDIGHGAATATGAGLSEAAAIDEGLDAYKGWLTVDDDRVRDDHLDAEGQTVAAGEMFVVGDDELAYPRDPAGSPEQTINCRCYLGWAPSLEAAEAGDWTALTMGDEDASGDQSAPDVPGVPGPNLDQDAAAERALAPSDAGLMQRLLQEEGGFTINAETGEQITEGYVVATEGSSGVMDLAEFEGQKGLDFIDKWLEDNAAIFDRADVQIGGWLDEEAGQVVLDPVEVFSSEQRTEAIVAGAERDQRAIYDLAGKTTVDTGGTGGYFIDGQVLQEVGPEAIGPSGKTAEELAKRLVDDAVPIEKVLTPEVSGVAADNGLTMEGLKFARKGEGSMARKIAGDAAEKGITFDEAAARINDSVRYTMIGEPDLLMSKATSVLDDYAKRGYTMRIKNTWAHPISAVTPYRGINVVMTDTKGFRWELQFHTPESFYTKEVLAHPLYEEARLLDSSTARYKELMQQMDVLGDRLEFPRGASEWGFEGLGDGVPHGQGVDLFMSRWEANGVDSYLSENDERIILSKVIVPESERGGGIGSKFMEDLSRYADQTGKRIDLSPSVDFGATSKKRLTDFYKQFGFVENKGKNIDHAISEAMYRLPQDLPPLDFGGAAPVVEGAARVESATETALADAKSIPDVEKILTDKWGAGSDRDDGQRFFKFKGMAPQSARDVAQEFDYMARAHPLTAERIHMVGSSSGLNSISSISKAKAMGRAYADAGTDFWKQQSSWLRFNVSKTKDYEALASELLANQESGWVMESDLKGVLRHEFGHHIDALARVNDEQHYLEEVRAVMKGHAATDLSTYAADSMKEMMAEAVSNATGANPTRLAQDLYDVAVKYSEKYGVTTAADQDLIEAAAAAAARNADSVAEVVEQSEIGKVADAFANADKPGFNAIRDLAGVDEDGSIAVALQDATRLWQEGQVPQIREAYQMWLDGQLLSGSELVSEEILTQDDLATFFQALQDATPPDVPLYRGMRLPLEADFDVNPAGAELSRMLEKGDPFDLPQTLSSFTSDRTTAEGFADMQNAPGGATRSVHLRIDPGGDVDALRVQTIGDTQYAHEREWVVGGKLRVTDIARGPDGSWELTVRAVDEGGYPMPSLPPPAEAKLETRYAKVADAMSHDDPATVKAALADLAKEDPGTARIAEDVKAGAVRWQQGYTPELREAYKAWLQGEEINPGVKIGVLARARDEAEALFTAMRDATPPDRTLYRGLVIRTDDTTGPMTYSKEQAETLKAMLREGKPFDLPATLTPFSQSEEQARVFSQNFMTDPDNWVRIHLDPGGDPDALRLSSVGLDAYAPEQEWLVGGDLRVTEIVQAEDGSWDLTVEAKAIDPEKRYFPVEEKPTISGLTPDYISTIPKTEQGVVDWVKEGGEPATRYAELMTKWTDPNVDQSLIGAAATGAKNAYTEEGRLLAQFLVDAPTVPKTLYLGGDYEGIGGVGSFVPLKPASFTTSKAAAEDAVTGAKPTVFEVQSGSRALPVGGFSSYSGSEEEFITGGNFRVVERREEAKWRVIVLQQTT